MDSHNFWSLLLLLLTITACSKQSSSDELAKKLKTIGSWTATAHLVGDSWLKGSVPTVYARKSLQSVQEELHKETKTLVKVTPPQKQAQVEKQLQGLENTVKQMAAAVEEKNPSSLTQELTRLSTQEQTLNQLVGTGKQP